MLGEAAAADGSGQFTELPAGSFGEAESISIDYAVMEPSRNLVVLPTRFSWNDIGSWSAVAGLVPQDEHGNRVYGDSLLVDCEDCFRPRRGPHHRRRGLARRDGRGHARRVAGGRCGQRPAGQGSVGATQAARGMKATACTAPSCRPWGTYTVLEGGEGYKIKRIEVKPGAALSLQMHHHRSEHWVVVSGTARVVCDEQEFLVMTNQSTYIPAGKKHRVDNPGMLFDLVMIEVQSGAYLGEDESSVQRHLRGAPARTARSAIFAGPRRSAVARPRRSARSAPAPSGRARSGDGCPSRGCASR